MFPGPDQDPLSPAQDQVWFLDQMRAGAAVEQLLTAALWLRGPLDTAALRAALTSIARRHEVLRTRYDTDGETAVPVVADPAPVDVAEVDLRGEADPEAAAAAVRTADLAVPVDLCTGPPWRVSLLRIGDEDAVLLITVHHIAFDGLSWSVLAAELDTLYTAHRAGLDDPLPSAPRYRDYARAARAAGESRSLDHWTERLAGLAPLALTGDRPRPAAWDGAGASVPIVVSAGLAAGLAALARANRVTPFMLHLACYQVLLARCSGNPDIGVGVSVSTRDRAWERAVGLFLNTVVFRTDMSDGPSFGDLLGRVRATVVEALAHASAPFEQVVARLAPGRDPSRNPVFQAGFAFHNDRRTRFRLDELEVETLAPVWGGSAFDLSLHLAEHADGSLEGQFIYPTRLFDERSVRGLADVHLRLLRSVVTAPDLPVTRLDIIPDADLAVLASVNAADSPPPGRTLPELVFEQARRTPAAPAVVWDGGSLTYAQFENRVRALTAHLRGIGVGRETPVGVMLDRGPDLPVAAVAIMAAGGVYVPLPPDHPAERVSFVLADTDAAVVLTHSELGPRVSEASYVVLLDQEWERLPAPDTALPQPDPDAAAYTVYTSGSTGKPKGVVVTHAGICNRVLWSVDEYGLGPGDRLLQKTTIGFDAAVWELFAPLVSGGVLVMAPHDAHRDPSVLVSAAARHGVTVLQVVPSVLRLLLAEPGLAACATLRLVCSAGEALPAELCARLTALLDVAVVNTYGPTECSIDATAWRYRGDERGTVPIGAPLPGLRAYVVDHEGELLPLGVPGELRVSGVGLARGYLGRPDLTAERFSPNPHGVLGERWYHTGDLVRRAPDGTLVYLGRTDDQVKVNGVRIEPGEVAAALRTHPDVADAAVVVRGGALAAYVATAPGAAPTADVVRAHAARVLPPAMVPSAVVILDALPLTPTGKVDRAALPDPAAVAGAGTGAALTTGAEREIAGIMAEVLGLPAVGADDDFFVLGGHSLVAIRLVLRLRRAFGVELSVADLFADRTVRALVARLAGGQDDDHAAIPVVAREPAPPLSFGQQRLWFLDQLLPASAEYLIPLALRVRGAFSAKRFRAALTEVARRHEVLRTRYVDRDGSPVQVVDPAGPVPVEEVDTTGAADSAEAGMAELDRVCSQPFDLAAEHPIRAVVVRVAPAEHLIAVSLHHIAFDAWSMGVFLRDLDDAYLGRATRPVPGVQVADFAAWQRAGEDGLAAQLEHWTARLAGLEPVELALDRPRGAERELDGGIVTAQVPADVGHRVSTLAAAHGATPFMVLLAGFQALLARYTGRTDIAVGTPVAGRTRPETEELVGFFTNTLVMRTDLGGDPSFTDVLHRVRSVVLDAFDHQDLPFERLVDVVSPERDLTRNPLFQVMFEVQHLDRFPAELGGAAVEAIRAGTPVAKFDLTLTVQHRPEGLRCVFEYATALFDKSTVERIAAHYLHLLAGAVADPATRLGELELMVATERDLIVSWAEDRTGRVAELDPPSRHGLTVPELFEEQARRTPHAVAVEYGSRRLTYAELDSRANRFAARLAGVGAQAVVAVCLERGVEAVVALLGTLKAGAVYAPFDPRHPVERLRFTLTDAGAALVVTAAEFADTFDGFPVLVADESDVAPPGTAPSAVRPRPGDLAYVIYTSGSTGRPKGVMIEHRAYAHHCAVITDAYGITARDRVVLLSALTFDVAMDQIAATLLAGATVVVAEAQFWAPADLPARLAGHGVTIMEITPAYYREVLEYDVAALSGLKLMNVGSDVVTVADARRWAATGLPGRFLCNYGPTEATVTCLLHPVAGSLPGERDTAALPIGCPVPGTQVYIVDGELRPVPVGVPGELLLGGVRLARGYLHRPALTAERFVPDPFSGDAGARLYRTGDLVRWRHDGAVEFLGRIDHQVKIRGLRMELGEIEAAIQQHPAVQAAAVIAVGTGADRDLAAYPVLRQGHETSVDELREHLRTLLPESMIPVRWAPLPRLPLTSSGKVDRRSLPEPVVMTDRPYAPPRDPTEQAVAGVWAEVLNQSDIGIHDDFFSRGGHSLLVTRVLSRLRRTFAVDLPLRTLFEATTIETQAAAIVEAIEAEVATLTDEEVATLLAD